MIGGEGIRRDVNGYLVTRGFHDAKRPWESPTRTYTPGRRCTCGARLSIYNEDDVCAPCSNERWAEH
jgi:hypothetical protein